MPKLELRIRLDDAFDGASWPGPLGKKEAVFGSAWLGPLGFLGFLETQLGLTAPWPTAEERAAALVKRARATEGYWQKSLEQDPFGTAAQLIAERDCLCMHGWRGQTPTRRLRELVEVTDEVLPGLPDRLSGVADALRDRSARLDVLELTDLASGLPVAWRVVVEELERRGTQTGQIEPSVVTSPNGDLSAARLATAERTDLSPSCDGSLQLLRPHGPIAAAEEVSAWLASQANLDRIVVIGADAVLDGALCRHALPISGAGHGEDAHLQLVNLVVEMGWKPADSALAHQLLLSPCGFVDRRATWALLRALRHWPAVDSDAWRDAIASLAEEEGGEAITRSIDEIFAQHGDRARGYPRSEVIRRSDLLITWANSRLRHGSQYAANLEGLIEKARIFRLVALTGQHEHLTEQELRRALAVADEAVTAPTTASREMGLQHVSRPEAIYGPAKAIVWWNFTRDAAPSVGAAIASAAEREALANEGVHLPDPSAGALRLATRWRRPLDLAEANLLLVCPQRNANGDECHPHPLWDEIAARVPDTHGAAFADLYGERVQARPPLPRRQVAALARPAPRRDWTTSSPVPRRTEESPSGMGALIGCSLSWTLRYGAKFYTGQAEPPSGVDPLSLGNLSHEILHRLLKQTPRLDPQAAAAQASAIFGREGPRLIAPLFLPEWTVECNDARERIAQAARTLFAHLQALDATVSATEQRVTVPELGHTLAGRPDLVITRPDLIIDLKWGNRKKYFYALKNGTAVQLAAYSRLVERDFPPAAYFILSSQELIIPETIELSGATRVATPPIETVWRAAKAAYDARLAQLAKRVVEASAVPDGSGGGVVTRDDSIDGRIVLCAACHYCDHGAICGMALEEER